MGELTRRTFLARSSIAAAALTGGVAAVAKLATSTPPVLSATSATPVAVPALGQPLVAHVRNIATGEVAVLMGTQEVIYRDVAVVQRLLGALRG